MARHLKKTGLPTAWKVIIAVVSAILVLGGICFVAVTLGWLDTIAGFF